jgi:hypothetical protein
MVNGAWYQSVCPLNVHVHLDSNHGEIPTATLLLWDALVEVVCSNGQVDPFYAKRAHVQLQRLLQIPKERFMFPPSQAVKSSCRLPHCVAYSGPRQPFLLLRPGGGLDEHLMLMLFVCKRGQAAILLKSFNSFLS